MKRLGALLVAIALVGGAWAVRGALWDDADTGDDDRAAPADRSSGEPLRVVCATEFAEACTALRGRDGMGDIATFTIESPGATVGALVADPTPAFDLWLVSEPWADVAAYRAEVAGATAPRLGRPTAGLATAELAVAARSEVLAAVGAGCPTGTVTGPCLTTGTEQLIVRDLDETAGLLAPLAFAAGFFDDPSFDALDVQTDDALRTALPATAARARAVADPVRELLTIRRFDVAIDLAPQHRLSAAAGADQYGTRAFGTGVRARAVLVPAAGVTGAVSRLGRERVVSALTSSGWSRTDDGTVLPGNGLAALDAITNLWSPKS